MNVFRCLVLSSLVFCCVGCTSKTCEDGYDLVGDRCKKTNVIMASYNTSYYCGTSVYNEQLVGNQCVWYTYTSPFYSNECPDDYGGYSICSHKYGRTSADCPYNYVKYLGKCYPRYVESTKKYYCHDGENLVNGRCEKKYSYYAYVKYNYNCPFGYEMSDEIDGVCIKTEYMEPTMKFSLFN